MLRFTTALIAVAVLAFPAAASARKNAWKLAGFDGQYTYQATATNPSTCGDDDEQPRNAILALDHSETIRGVKPGTTQHVAKYWPALLAPNTNSRGQSIVFERTQHTTWTYRIFDTVDDESGASVCVSRDERCTIERTIRTRERPFVVWSLDDRRRPTVYWHLRLAQDIGEGCLPRSALFSSFGMLKPEEEEHPDPGQLGVVPIRLPTTVPVRRFARRSATYRVASTLPVKGRNYSGEIVHSASARIRKVVIADGCRDTRPQSLFACSP